MALSNFSEEAAGCQSAGYTRRGVASMASNYHGETNRENAELRACEAAAA
jgi:hypothetical protein